MEELYYLYSENKELIRPAGFRVCKKTTTDFLMTRLVKHTVVIILVLVLCVVLVCKCSLLSLGTPQVFGCAHCFFTWTSWACEINLSPPPVIYYRPFQAGSSVVVFLLLVLVTVSVLYVFLMYVHII